MLTCHVCFLQEAQVHGMDIQGASVTVEWIDSPGHYRVARYPQDIREINDVQAAEQPVDARRGKRRATGLEVGPVRITYLHCRGRDAGTMGRLSIGDNPNPNPNPNPKP